MKRLLLIYLCSIFLMACAKEIDTSLNDYGKEIINGFTVNWDKQVTKEQHDVIVDILNDMLFVEGGIFVMGATDEQIATGETRYNEYPAHFVQLKDFYICKHEFTKEQGRKLFVQYYNKAFVSGSWYDYYGIIQQLRKMTGLEFDMPTEAQWEYAARGGGCSHNYIYPGGNNLADVWCGIDQRNDPILSDTPNELGIYNMADGRSEWCKDYYSSYSSYFAIQNNPCVEYGSVHVIRGGMSSLSKPHEYSSLEQRWKESITYPSYDQSACRITFRSAAEEHGWSATIDYGLNITVRFVLNIDKL